MTLDFILALGAIFQLIFPEIFSFRYSSQIIWDRIIAASKGDSDKIREFWRQIDEKTFARIRARDVILSYIDYGQDIVSIYVSLILTLSAIVVSLIVHSAIRWVILVDVIMIGLILLIGLEIQRRLPRRRISVYSQWRRFKLKIPIIAINILLIVIPSVIQMVLPKA